MLLQAHHEDNVVQVVEREPRPPHALVPARLEPVWHEVRADAAVVLEPLVERREEAHEEAIALVVTAGVVRRAVPAASTQAESATLRSVHVRHAQALLRGHALIAWVLLSQETESPHREEVLYDEEEYRGEPQRLARPDDSLHHDLQLIKPAGARVT